MAGSKSYVLSCGVLALDLTRVASRLGVQAELDFLEGGLHNRPLLLRQKLQAAIDRASDQGDFDRIILGYGVCGLGTVGLQARRTKLVLPRVHDCVALFLGGNSAYQSQFRKYPGTYYITAGWCAAMRDGFLFRPQTAYLDGQTVTLKELQQRYGRKAAEDLYRFLSSWQRNYRRLAYIDTGGDDSRHYQQRARDFARGRGWIYEHIQGSDVLLRQLLTATESSEAILVVPPGYVVDFDPLSAGLRASPPLAPERKSFTAPAVVVDDHAPPVADATGRPKVGLGIDAGGTYTDAVIYDLHTDRLLAKAKALTTKWDFTQGIAAALRELDPRRLQKVQLVCLSTTLATNAIVEGQGQKVGLLLLPPPGLSGKDDIQHSPKAVLSACLDISGTEIAPVDSAEVRLVAREMIADRGVQAFAVSGYAGVINPEHELKVKRIIEKETGLPVVCGHELSDLLDFQARAYTAVFNARIVPRLAKLLSETRQVLGQFGVRAPIMVVKGDGSLIRAELAQQRPVETILSGPAASVAGARHLTGLPEAVVVDLGGTTTDIALLVDGEVKRSEKGAEVGGYHTHIRALDMRTLGLGGDSVIHRHHGAFTLGPQRVAPMAWAGGRYGNLGPALEFVDKHLDRYYQSTRGMELLTLVGSGPDCDVTEDEAKILELLRQRPFTLDELAARLGAHWHGSLPLRRLEEMGLIQRCGLTPTDCLHVVGKMNRWDTTTALSYCRKMARLARMEAVDLAEHLLNLAARTMAMHLLQQCLLDTDGQVLQSGCPICSRIAEAIFADSNAHLAIRPELKKPLVGVGAPAHFFVPWAAALLGARAVIPDHAEVANAIGAVTSEVVVRSRLYICPDHAGRYRVEGLPAAPTFDDIAAADAYARTQLLALTRGRAQAAGTDSRRVVLRTEDKVAATSEGTEVFISRSLEATLTGRPATAPLGKGSTASRVP